MGRPDEGVNVTVEGRPARRGRAARLFAPPRPGGDAAGEMDVSELMERHVVRTTAGETLCGAATLMRDHEIGALVVVDEDDQLVGIVTERDLLRAAADGRGPRETRVGRYMSRVPATIEPDTECAAAARLMAQLGVRHLPVTHDHRPVGMLAARDLLLVEAWRREAEAAP
jgi:CBS domain-containing protein